MSQPVALGATQALLDLTEISRRCLAQVLELVATQILPTQLADDGRFPARDLRDAYTACQTSLSQITDLENALRERLPTGPQ